MTFWLNFPRYSVLCLNLKIFIHVFPELVREYGFRFKIMLPCLLGTFPRSRDGRCNSWLSSHCNPDCVARDASQSRFQRDGYPFPAHLSNQLRHLSSPNMVLGPTTGHHRNTSESGYSATSSNEGAKQYSDAYQHWLSVQNSDSTDTIESPWRHNCEEGMNL